MNIEKYVLDNFLNRIIKFDNNGEKYILDYDLKKLNLASSEERFVFQVMEDNKIGVKRDLIGEKDRAYKVSEFNFGDKESYGLDDRDVPKIAEIEYNDDGTLIFENYDKLDEFIEKDFIPNNVVMTRRRDSEDPDKELVGLIQKKDGTTMKRYRKKLYPTIQLNQIIKLGLSDKEIAHVMDYLNNEGIIVRGRDSSIDQEFENYDYYSTYKNQILPTALTKDECAQKFAIYSVTKDPVIKEQLILGNLRLVPYVAWMYSIIYYKDINELESYGVEGLIEAIDRFDPTRGNNFSTFAIEYIKGYIKRGIPELDGVSRGDWSATFYRCKKIVEEIMGQTLDENPKLASDINELMFKEWEAKLSVNPKVNVAFRPSKDPEILKSQMNDNLLKINFYFLINVDESMEQIESLESEFNLDDLVINSMLKKDLEDALSNLTDREIYILSLRYGLDGKGYKSCYEVGKIINRSRERVRQIEVRALRKLRTPSISNKLRDYVYLDSGNSNSDVDGDTLYFSLGYGNIYDQNSGTYKMFEKEWNKAILKLKR